MTFKELLKIRGLTQEDLAAKLGITQQAVSCWVNGQTAPRTRQFKGVAKALGVSVKTLYDCFKGD